MSKLKPTMSQQGVFYYTADSKGKFLSIPAPSKPMCFRLKTRTSLYVFAYRPRENDWKTDENRDIRKWFQKRNILDTFHFYVDRTRLLKTVT